MIQMCIIAYNLNIKGRPLDERFAICDCYSRYMASNYGAIYDTMTHNLLSQHRHITEGRSSIYLRVNVMRDDGKKRDVGVNRLVLMAWKPLPDSDYSKYEANHIDRNTLNNQLYNLEWLTHLGNVQHYYNSINAEIIYNDDIVRSMCEHLQNGEMYEDICKLIGIPYNDQTSSYLSALRNRRIRTDISSHICFQIK